MVIKYSKLLASIGICFTPGIIGSFFTFQSIPTWYATLNKPSFSPPNWVFGPVWTTLYVLMGISLYIIWSSESKHKKHAIKLFIIQLFLNGLWSILFFGLRNPLLGLVGIVVLGIYIILSIIAFYKVSKIATYFLFPYILWVSFASLLNLMIVLLNR